MRQRVFIKSEGFIADQLCATSEIVSQKLNEKDPSLTPVEAFQALTTTI